jgi:S-adenosylmethionine decarboxylase
MDSQHKPVLYVVDCAGCRALAGLPPRDVIDTFVSALTKAGATVVQTASHHFPGTGLTAVVILAESHAVLHSWPETGTLHLDIFSCSARLDTHAAIDEMARVFGAAGVSIQEVPRVDGHSPAPDRP